MRKLFVFNHVTLDGYFVSHNGDFTWARNTIDDPEYAAFEAENAKGDAELLFGRVTYDLMAKYWPTPLAAEQAPTVAAGLNRMPKIVFSRTLKQASWTNTRVINGDPISAIRQLKSEPGPDMLLMGSGTIIAQLAPEGLIDEYQMMVDPVVLGSGRSMFEGIPQKLALRQTKSRSFQSGKTFLCYEPAA